MDPPSIETTETTTKIKDEVPPSSSTIKYKARKGDTVQSIATAASIKPEEITVLNKDLKTTSKLMANRTYLLPRNASHNSFGAVNDIMIEWNARKTEAKEDDK